MLTSTYYRTLPNSHLGAMPNGGAAPGTRVQVNAAPYYLSADDIARETRFSPGGQYLGCLEGEAAWNERQAGNTGLLAELAALVGGNGLDRLASNDARITLVAGGMANLTNGPIATRINAMIAADAPSPLSRTEYAKQLLGLLIDVA